VQNDKPYGIIYRITNLLENKVYIGQTRTLLRIRWQNHKDSSKYSPTYIGRVIAKCGSESFKIEEIDTAFSQEELDYMEKYWIKFYDSINRSKGYNLTSGGLDNYNLDKEATKRAIKKRLNYYIQCIETGEIFSSMAEAGRIKGCSRTNIGSCIIGKLYSSGGFGWRKINKNEPIDETQIIKENKQMKKFVSNPKKRRVICRESGEIFSSIKEAGESIGLSNNYFRFILKNKKLFRNKTYECLDSAPKQLFRLETIKAIQSRDRSSNMKRVKCLETNQIWPSLKDVALDTNSYWHSLSTAILHKDGKFKGRTYVYV
jgi:group I intron endonuclease